MKVLLAVTDPALRALWEDVLADHGHQTLTATPDRSAWSLALEARPTLAIVELGDRAEALGLCRRLRQPGYDPRPDLLVLVPADRPEEMVTALRAGADDVLGGPPDRRSAMAHLAALERRHTPPPVLGRPAHELATRRTPDSPSEERLPPNEPAATRLRSDPPPRPDAELAERLVRALAAALTAAAATPAAPQVRSAFELARELTRALQSAGPAPEPRPADEPPAPAGPARATILLIDDEASVRYPLRMALQQYGYRVLEAADGAEGLDLIAARGDEISLVVVDQRMPRVSGAEVLRELRRRPRYVPAVLMSGQAADQDPAAAGADAYLRKPFELADLARTVRRLVGADVG